MSKGALSESIQTPVAAIAFRSTRLAELLRRAGRRWLLAGAVALALALAAGDAITGIEVPFTLLYLVPVSFAAWLVGRRAGQGIAAICTAGGIASEVLEPNARTHVLTAVWASATTLGVFLVMVELLDRLRAHVEREERARTAALEQLRHSERLNAIGKIAAGVAHEIATPLSAITLNAELVARGRRRDEGAEKSARRILEQAARVNAIVSRLLQFGRKGEHARTRIDLREVIEKNVELLRPLAQKQRCSLLVSLPAAPLWIEASALELSQVVTNLVMNAVQATPGGGAVSIACGEEDDAHATVSVNDTGVGIRPENLPHLFEPFFTTKGEGAGTGLGLSITAGIVEEHGGSIRVTSRVGEGSRFTVVLPRTNGVHVPPPPPISSSSTDAAP